MSEVLIPEPITIAERISYADCSRPVLHIGNVALGWNGASSRPRGIRVDKIIGEGGQGGKRK